jgi:dihydrofolate reductase
MRLMLSLIAAMSENRVIGRGGGLPWRLPVDLKHFQETTRGHTVIMGRKTFESLDRPLPHRTNIVITRNPDYAVDGVKVVRSLDEAICAAESEVDDDTDDREIFILGGEEIFRQSLCRADRMYLTIVHAELEGDTFFPAFDADDWRVVIESHHPADAKNQYACSFQTLERAR